MYPFFVPIFGNEPSGLICVQLLSWENSVLVLYSRVMLRNGDRNTFKEELTRRQSVRPGHLGPTVNCRWRAENTPTGLPHLFAEACIFGKPKKGQTRVLMVNEKKSPRPPRCPPGAPPRAVSGHRFPRWRCYAYVRKTPLLAPQKRVFCTFPLYTGPDRPQMTTFTHILGIPPVPLGPV